MTQAPGDAPNPFPALPPMNVSGLVVKRADLVTALRIYVPQLVDVTPLEGDRFLLSLGSGDSEGT